MQISTLLSSSECKSMEFLSILNSVYYYKNKMFKITLYEPINKKIFWRSKLYI